MAPAFPLTALVLPGDTEIGLELRRALCVAKEVRLLSASQSTAGHAPYAYRSHHTIPSVREPGWLGALNRLIRDEGVDLVLPAHDDVLVALAAERERVEATVVSSPAATCRITRSKRSTYRHLGPFVPVPREFRRIEEIEEYPVFVKPDRGQGSSGAQRVDSRMDLDSVVRQVAGSWERFLGSHLCLEHLPGPEYTVDCFSDREEGLLFCAARERSRTRAGISMSSRFVALESLSDLATAIAGHLDLRGAWFFQMKRSQAGRLTLLEVAPRIAGTSACTRMLGVNLPLLSIYEQLRLPVSIETNEVELTIDRALVNRYRHDLSYRRVYVDLDDTLLVRGTVNLDLVRFLYQCVNGGTEIVLLTRHAGDLEATLRRHRLAGIFDQVVQVKGGEEKGDFIDPEGAILIDDSFRERRSVAERWKIPTLDPSMVELLADDRC